MCLLASQPRVSDAVPPPLPTHTPTTPAPPDLNLLKHDKPLAASGAAAAAAHLKHLPAYLRDPSLQGKSFVGNTGELAGLGPGWCAGTRAGLLKQTAPSGVLEGRCCSSLPALVHRPPSLISLITLPSWRCLQAVARCRRASGGSRRASTL